MDGGVRRDDLDGISAEDNQELGKDVQEKYEAIEEFLVRADPDWDDETFRKNLLAYLDMLVALLREKDQMQDLR